MVDFYTATEEAYKNGYKAGYKACMNSLGSEFAFGDKVLIQGYGSNEWHEGHVVGFAWSFGEDKTCTYVVKWKTREGTAMSVASANHLRLVEHSRESFEPEVRT